MKTQTTAAKTETTSSQTRRLDSTGHFNSPFDQFLMLQRLIGNQAVQRLFNGGVVPTKHQNRTLISRENDTNVSCIRRSPLSDELEQIWLSGNKDEFFLRLRALQVSDPDVLQWVNITLTGDDLWLAQNLIYQGPETTWPIHLKIEREMKGWPDCRGEQGVYDILRAAKGAEAGNPALSASISTIFAGKPLQLWYANYLQKYGPRSKPLEELFPLWFSGNKAGFYSRLRGLTGSNPDVGQFINDNLTGDDLWLSRNIFIYGPEAKWPIQLRVEREMKGWPDCGGEQGVYDILKAAKGAEASNAALTASINTIFSGKPQQLWYSQHLQKYGLSDQHKGAILPDAAVLSNLAKELYPTSTSSTGAVLLWDGGSGSALSPAAKTTAKADLIAKVTTAMTNHLTSAMSWINPLAAIPRLAITEFEGAGKGAKRVTDAKYDSYVTAAAPTASKPTGRNEFQFRASGPGKTLFDAYDPAQRATAGCPIDEYDLAKWIAKNNSASRTAQAGHNFNPDRPGFTEERDFLWNTIVVPFASAHTADLRKYDQFGFGMSTERGIVTGTSIDSRRSTAPGPTGGPSLAVRGAKWETWKTLVHEYIHFLAHPAFDKAAKGNPILNEGFCEMFTKEVLLDAIPKVPGNSTLITEVEGGIYPPLTNAALVGPYSTPAVYADNLKHAEKIKNTAIGTARGGPAAVKAAFFQGHVEYLGLTPGGMPATAAPAGGADLINKPLGVNTLAELVTATGVAESGITTANVGLTAAGPLPAQLHVPGCRDHIVVESIDPTTGASTMESQSRIAAQNGVTPLDLARANPGVNWSTLTRGQHILIPKH